MVIFILFILYGVFAFFLEKTIISCQELTRAYKDLKETEQELKDFINKTKKDNNNG